MHEPIKLAGYLSSCLLVDLRYVNFSVFSNPTGLFFLSYQRDPAQFITLQKRLSSDLLNEYIRHVGSGIWAIPAGADAGSYLGADLFA